MADDTAGGTFRPGQRVRVPSRGAAHRLTNTRGTIVRLDPYNAGHWIVRLDVPGVYYRADGATAPLPEVREDEDNLELLTVVRSGDGA